VTSACRCQAYFGALLRAKEVGKSSSGISQPRTKNSVSIRKTYLGLSGSDFSKKEKYQQISDVCQQDHKKIQEDD
jgi:hypothetical protein